MTETLVTAKQATVEHDFGEATVTSKGQITVPSDLRKALDISAGDRLRFVQANGRFGPARGRASADASSISLAPMRFAPAKPAIDIDKTIDEADHARHGTSAIEEAAADDRPRHECSAAPVRRGRSCAKRRVRGAMSAQATAERALSSSIRWCSPSSLGRLRETYEAKARRSRASDRRSLIRGRSRHS